MTGEGNACALLDVLEDTVVLPFLATEVWLKSGGIPEEAAWAHAAVACAAAALYLLDDSLRDKLLDGLQLVSAVSLATAGMMCGNSYAVAAAAAYALARFNFKRYGNCVNIDCVDLYNFALCAFVVCALVALQGKAA